MLNADVRCMCSLITPFNKVSISSPVRLSWIVMCAALFITKSCQFDIKCMKRGISELVNENETLFFFPVRRSFISMICSQYGALKKSASGYHGGRVCSMVRKVTFSNGHNS